MYPSRPSSRLVYKAASGFWEKERERGREGAACASLLRPQLQLGHCHSCCILLIKTSYEVSWDPRGEKTDPNYRWRELESQIAKVLVQRRMEDWGTTTPALQGELLGPLPSPPLDPSAEPKLNLGLISDPAHLRLGSTWAVGPIFWSQTLINPSFSWVIGTSDPKGLIYWLLVICALQDFSKQWGGPPHFSTGNLKSGPRGDGRVSGGWKLRDHDERAEQTLRERYRRERPCKYRKEAKREVDYPQVLSCFQKTCLNFVFCPWIQWKLCFLIICPSLLLEKAWRGFYSL